MPPDTGFSGLTSRLLNTDNALAVSDKIPYAPGNAPVATTQIAPSQFSDARSFFTNPNTPSTYGDLGRKSDFSPSLGSIKTKVDSTATQNAYEKQAASEAKGQAIGAGASIVSTGIGMIAHHQETKAAVKRQLGALARDFSDREFMRRYEENVANQNQIRKNLGMQQSLQRQAGNTAAGGQKQLFLRDPNTGLLV